MAGLNPTESHFVESQRGPACPDCGSGPEHRELRNYSPAFHDGDIHCTLCGAYVRGFDAG
jgi:hypothetical protein